ncbi:L-lactate permease, partial [Butyricicoccus sp. 1XD8-22]
FIALLPLLAVIIFLFFLKQTTLRAGVFSFLFTMIITWLVPNFHLTADQIMLSSLKGVLISFIAAYILFFGIFLFHLMNNIGAIQSIATSISHAT